MSEITRILKSIEQGGAQATEELLPLVYEELRRLARRGWRMRRQGIPCSRQPWFMRHGCVLPGRRISHGMGGVISLQRPLNPCAEF